MQKIATRIFMAASVSFGFFGIVAILTDARDGSFLTKSVLVSVFIILPSFALSVAGKYLNGK